MCAVLNYRSSKLPFITIDLMRAVLNDVKCPVEREVCGFELRPFLYA